MTACSSPTPAQGDDDDDGADAAPAAHEPDASTDPGFTPDGGAVPVDPLTIEQFFKAQAKDYCARFFGCCTAAEATQLFAGAQPPVTDAASCEMLLGAVNAFHASQIDGAVAAGQMTWDAAAAAQCLAAIEGTSCADFARVATLTEISEMSLCAAHQPVHGTVVNDMPCTDYLQGGGSCQGGYCEKGTVTGMEVFTCKPLPALGQPCPEYQCATGSFCESATCKAPKPDGQSCQGGEECTSHGCPGADAWAARAHAARPIPAMGSEPATPSWRRSARAAEGRDRWRQLVWHGRDRREDPLFERDGACGE